MWVEYRGEIHRPHNSVHGPIQPTTVRTFHPIRPRILNTNSGIWMHDLWPLYVNPNTAATLRCILHLFPSFGASRISIAWGVLPPMIVQLPAELTRTLTSMPCVLGNEMSPVPAHLYPRGRPTNIPPHTEMTLVGPTPEGMMCAHPDHGLVWVDVSYIRVDLSNPHVRDVLIRRIALHMGVDPEASIHLGWETEKSLQYDQYGYATYNRRWFLFAAGDQDFELGVSSEDTRPAEFLLNHIREINDWSNGE